MIETVNSATVVVLAVAGSVIWVIYSRLRYNRAPSLAVLEAKVLSPKLELDSISLHMDARILTGNGARVSYHQVSLNGVNCEFLEIHLQGYRDWVKLEFDNTELVLYTTPHQVLYEKGCMDTPPSTFGYAHYILCEVRKALVREVWRRLEDTEPLGAA